MSTRNHSHILVNSTVSVNGDWVLLDWKFKSIQQRTLSGTLTANAVSAGDSVVLQVTPDDVLTAASIENVFDVTAFTTTEFTAILNGPWTYVRAQKTGGNGVGTIFLVG